MAGDKPPRHRNVAFSVALLRGRFANPPSFAGDGAALLALVAVVLVSFRDAITQGLIAFEADTLRYYYPLEAWFASEFKNGRFPLWNPYILAGYSFFSDSELGLAYPLHLLLLFLLPVDQAFIWLRISTVLVAAAGSFALCRALRLGPVPALIGGITFSLGSFLVAQVHHEDMTRTVAWAPLILACIEWGLCRSSWRRHLLLTGAAVGLANSALGLHPQGLAIVLLATLSFIAARTLVAGEGERRTPTLVLPRRGGGDSLELRRQGEGDSLTGLLGWRRRLAAILAAGLRRVGVFGWTTAFVVGVGLGLASVQLLPLAESGAATYRFSQPDYAFATSYSFPIVNLVDLVFPYFFRGADDRYWSLWSEWETTLYVGVVPLLLGFVGLFAARRGMRWYFAALALVGLWLAAATYAPVDLYQWLWALPVFSALRVPGRYTLLVILGWSVLAAYGAQRLGEPAPRSWKRWLALAGVVALILSAVGGLIVGFDRIRAGLLVDREAGLVWIANNYFTLRHQQEPMQVTAVLAGLLHTLDVTTPRTALSGAMLAVGGLAVGTALVRGARGSAWRLVVAALTAVDLLVFASAMHHTVAVGDITPERTSTQFLAARAGDGRVFSPFPVPTIETDRLAPFHVEDFGGYSSLDPRPNFSYNSQLTGTQNQLLDLAGIRYIAYAKRRPALASFNYVFFDPQRPLMVGSRGTVGGAESFAFDDYPGDQVRVVATLTHATAVPQGQAVAEITVVPTLGQPISFMLRAGVDVAEWAYDRSDIKGKVQHSKPDSVAFRRNEFDPVSETQFPLYLFYSDHNLSQKTSIRRIDVRYVGPIGGIEIYGLALWDFNRPEQAQSATQMDRTDFHLVYEDPDMMIMENVAAFPKAYIVPGARRLDPTFQGAGALLHTPFDPRNEVLLDGPGAQDWVNRSGPVVSTTTGPPPPPAGPVEQDANSARYVVSTPKGGFLVRTTTFSPSWHAWLDGQPVPVLRANYLFQAVPILPGTHTIEIRYEPAAVALGFEMTVWAALLAIAVLVGSVVGSRIEARRLG